MFYGVASASFTELHLLNQTLAESDRLFKRPDRCGRVILLDANARSHAVNNGKAEFRIKDFGAPSSILIGPQADKFAPSLLHWLMTSVIRFSS